MLLTQDHPDFDRTIVLLDGRWVRTLVAANDEEGWVDIPDLAAMAPNPMPADPDKEEKYVAVDGTDEEDELEAWEQMPLKRKFGKVEFKYPK